MSPVWFKKRSKSRKRNASTGPGVSHQSTSFAGESVLSPNGKSVQIPRRLRSMSPVKSLQSSSLSGDSMSRSKPPYVPLLEEIETHRTVAISKRNTEHWTRIACFRRRRFLCAPAIICPENREPFAQYACRGAE